jgi:hypothetical protein
VLVVKHLEGLFAELSATIYGVPLLLWRVGRSPVRGALRLYVQHRRKQEAHIGPHSAVLLTALSIWFWGGPASGETFREFMGGLLTGAGGLTEPLVTSVIVAGLIDGGCRVCARLRYGRDIRRRSRAIAMLLYAAAFGLAVLGPLFWLVILTPAVGEMIGLPRGTFALMLFVLLLIAAPLAASWPVMAIFNALRQTRWRDSQLQGLFPYVVLFGFMVVPTFASGLVRWIQTPPVLLSSPYVACTLDETAVGVVAVLRNDTGDVMIVDSRNLAVRLTGGKREIILQVPVEVIRSSLSGAGGLVTIPPRGSGFIEASADLKHPQRSNDLPARERPELCQLVKRKEREPLWLGEPKGGFFDLLPVLGSYRPWPDPSQETFDGSGAVDDRRAAH